MNTKKEIEVFGADSGIDKACEENELHKPLFPPNIVPLLDKAGVPRDSYLVVEGLPVSTKALGETEWLLKQC